MSEKQYYNEKLRKLQHYELNILKHFASFCEKNNLRYYLIGGTMLGAIRHEGFIPWDDDVDVGMPREDYEKFISIVEKDLPEYYSFLNYKKNDEYLRYFSRIVDNRVKIHNASNTNTLIESAWIDIFPLDGTPNNEFLRKLHFTYLSAKRVLYHFSCFEELVNLNRPGRPFYQRVIIKIGQKTKIARNLDSKKILDSIEKSLMKYKFDNSKYMVNFFGAYVFKELINRDWVGKGKKYKFEDSYLNGPVSPDKYLRQFYGDYMIPPTDSQKDKHNIIDIIYEE